jgi:hypothetical protein
MTPKREGRASWCAEAARWAELSALGSADPTTLQSLRGIGLSVRCERLRIALARCARMSGKKVVSVSIEVAVAVARASM